MEQTAVEYLIEELRNDIVGHISDVKLHVLIETALAMEKEQIMEAYVNGAPYGSERAKQCEMYYNETFKNR